MKHLKNKRFLFFFLGALLGVFVLLITLTSIYVVSFTKTANLSFKEMINIYKKASLRKNEFQKKPVNFLILGLDRRTDALENTLLTDTIMLASIETGKNNLKIIPLPRDLWLSELKTKINALYFYGEQKEKGQGSNYAANEISRITGATIDYFVVLDYTDLPVFVDLLNGISITISEPFEDNQYPNPNFIDNLSDDPYMTVKFENGKQNFNGEKALQYVRSRHSNDSEGSDLARTKRQMQVLQAIIEKLKSRSLLLKPSKLGSLYRFFHEQIQTNLENEDALALALSANSKPLNMEFISLPVQYLNNEPPLLTHPPVSKYGLWVWEIADPSWKELQKFMQNNLN